MRRLRGALAAALLLVPLATVFAGTAHAATTALSNPTGSPAVNQGVAYGGGNDARTADASHTFTGTGTFTGADPSPVNFTVTSADSGGGTDGAHQGQNDPCAISNEVEASGETPGTFTYTCVIDNIPPVTEATTDTLNITSGTATATATKVWAGVPRGVTMTPETDTATVGICNPYQVVVRDAASTGTATTNAGTPAGTTGTTGSTPAGNPNPNAPVEVNITPAGTNPPANSTTVTFCDPQANSNVTFTNPQVPTNGSGTGTQGAAQPAGSTGTTSRTGRFTADENGVVTFGIASNGTGSYTVTSFVETRTDNGAVDCGGAPATFTPATQPGSYAGSTGVTGCEPYAVSTKTFIAGGAPSIGSIAGTPATSRNVVGYDHVVRVIACTGNEASNTGGNLGCGAGFPVSGATITAVAVDRANPANTITGTCTPTNQQGIATCTVDAPNNAGVYDINLRATGSPGPASAVVEKRWIASTIDLDVQNPEGSAGSPVGTAPLPCSTADTTSQSTVTQEAGTVRRICVELAPTGGGAAPDAGQPVTFSLSGPAGATFVNCEQDPNQTAPAGRPGSVPVTGNPVVASDANGFASVCVRSTSAGTVTVTATAPGGLTDSGTVVFTTAVANARNLNLTPPTVTAVRGTTQRLTATVTDQFGNPVAGVAVDFTNSGVGRFANGNQSATATTGENGQAVADLQTTATDSLGDSTVTATIAASNGATQCAQPAGTPAGATAGNCSDTSTVTWTAQATTTTTTAPPGGGGGGPGNQQAGYTMVAADGGVFNFGTDFFGSTGNIRLNSPIVGMAYTANGRGYWLVAADGGIFAFGNAVFRGSTGNIRLNSPIVGMAATKTGQGYWMVAADGGVFAFGDAAFHGSTGNIRLNSPIVDMIRTLDGGGYWLVASDGGIFSFGNAAFHGSTGNIRLAQPIVGGSATPNGRGYWLVASDGGIFAFGDARFFGSTGNIRLNQPVVGMIVTPTGNGYWLLASDGGVFAFGDAVFRGSTGNIRLNSPIVGGSAPGVGQTAA